MTYPTPEIGGPTPIPSHHVLTFYAPATGVGKGCVGTEEVDPPLEQWEPLTYVGYQATRAATGVAPEAFANHDVMENSAPLGAVLVTIGHDEQGKGGHSVIQPCYSGTAPAVGSQVVSDGAGCVRAATTGEEGIGEVMRICATAADGTKRLDLLI